MKVVFHADDFGLMPAMNAGILEAHRRGVLGSTSLMVPGGAASEAVAMAQATPTLDVGIHLTLVEEPPVLPPAAVPSLVDGDRFWRDHPKVAQRYLAGRWRAEEAIRELEAQWARFDALGLRASHADGHQHLHLLPGVFPAVVAAARRRGVRFVRTWLSDPLATPGGLVRRGILLVMRGVCQLAWIRVPAGDRAGLVSFPTIGFVQAGGTMTVEGLLQTLDRMRARGHALVEVMLHPGSPDPAALARYGHWRYHWENDLALLCDPRLRAGLADRGIDVTTFRALASDG